MKKKILLGLLVAVSLVYGYPKDSPSSGMKEAGISAFGTPGYRDEMFDMANRYVEVKLTSAQVKTLNTTPVLVLSTPSTGYTLLPVAVYGFLDFSSAAWVSNSNNPLTIEYGGSGSGNIAVSITDSKLMEGTADTQSFTYASEYNAVGERALYAHVSGGNPTVGDSPIWLRIYYRLVPSVLNIAQ